ncbi:MAG TPA: hypothetical protein VFW33_11255, partial [Gemmataceae bacterium]|nr:hypothetical protein [Gemmataceae bacterium]
MDEYPSPGDLSDHPLPEDLADQSVRQTILLLQGNLSYLEAKLRVYKDKLREAIRLGARRWELDRDYGALRAVLGALLAGEGVVIDGAGRQDLVLDEQVGALREAIDRLTRERPGGGGAPGAPPSRYEGVDAELIRGALIKLKYLNPDAALPEPNGTRTGKKGKSRVYFLWIPASHAAAGSPEGASLVAKCDKPERARRECERVEHLRGLGVPPSVQLPMNLLHAADDRTLIYQAHGRGDSLENFLQLQLLGSRPNCERAVELAFQPGAMGWFYAKGTPHTAPGAWGDFFPEMAGAHGGLLKAAGDAWPGVDWANEATFRLPDLLGQRELHNPFPHLVRLLALPTGPVWLSLAHGDLNLTNVLVDQSANFAPTGVILIDFPFTERDRGRSRLTAIDFACFESEFWKEVYLSLLDEGKLDLERALRSFVTVRDYLEGRSDSKPRSRSPLPAEALNLIRHVRHYAHQALSREPPYL